MVLQSTPREYFRRSAECALTDESFRFDVSTAWTRHRTIFTLLQVVKSRIQGTTKVPGIVPKYNWTYPAYVVTTCPGVRADSV